MRRSRVDPPATGGKQQFGGGSLNAEAIFTYFFQKNRIFQYTLVKFVLKTRF